MLTCVSAYFPVKNKHDNKYLKLAIIFYSPSKILTQFLLTKQLGCSKT